ncbi:ATP-binding protein [Pseudomonadota bacterium]
MTDNTTSSPAQTDALRESEDRFSKVFDASPSMIAISTVETGQHYAVNEAWLKTMGFTREETIGKTAQELGVWPNTEDREAFITAFKAEGSVRDVEVELKTKSGELRTFSASGDKVEYDGEPRLLLVFHDITERKAAEGGLERKVEERTSALKDQVAATKQAEGELLDSEQRLQETNRMLHLVLDAIPVRVFWKDNDLNYLGCNRLFAMDAGFSSPRQVVGKSDFQMGWKQQAELYRADDQRVMNSKQAQLNYEEPKTTPEGDDIWLRTSKIPLRNGEGEVIGVLGLYEDITERKAAQQDLETAKDAAETANQAKSSFLSSMSHELRTPLNAILGFAQLMEYDPAHPLAEQQLESVEHIKKGGQHLLELINEILDLAKIEAGHLKLEIQDIDPQDVVVDVLSMTEAMADKYDVTVQAPKMGKCPGHIAADLTRFKQVLLNLLSNAVKYNRTGGQVTLDCEEGDGHVKISVTDTGEGIPAEKLDELFKPFARLGAEETAIEGTGIGLTITKELVARMGGEIGVESTLGEGTTFWIAMPLHEGAKVTGVAREVFQGGHVKDEGFDGTVLYVEDNAANMLFLESVFERFSNLRLITATNAEDGIVMAKAQNPDMLILDIALPGMSGNEAVAALRTNAGFTDKPIIALSANAMQSDIQAGLDAGFDVYLTKPLNIDALMAELEKVFGEVVLDED